MNINSSKDSAEDEEVFVDASASPELAQGLRRSARKRKSTCGEDALDNKGKQTGKRHRPLGNMQRSPTTNENAKKTTRPEKRHPVKQPTLTVQTDPPTPTPTPDQLVLLGGMRAVLKEELGETEKRLTGRMNAVESGFENLQDEFKVLERRMDAVEKRLDRNKSLGTESMLSLTNCPKQERYWKARRSLRLWPIEGEGENLRVGLQIFLSQRLRLGEDILSDVGDCSLRRIPSPKGNSNIKNEVTVEFPSTDLRDAVRSAAFNLAGHPDAGIRLEIPHHLMSNFKALNAASYKLKQRHKNCKRNIKYADEDFDLVLDFKTSENDRWRRLKPAQARELMLNEGEAAEEISTADLTEILDGRPGDEDDPEDDTEAEA